MITSRCRRFRTRGSVAVLAALATGGVLLTGVTPAVALDDPAPTMPLTFTNTVAPVPSFVTSAGGPLSLTRQTVTGMAAQKYGLTPGMTAAQTAAVQAGFSSSLTYPTPGPAAVVASAVGVFAAGNTTPVSAAAPGCSPNVGGAARRVVVTRSGSTYRLSVSGPQSSGFRAAGSWRLPAHGTERPLAVTVLDTTCSFDASSAVAVTFPSGIDYFAYDGTGNAGWSPAPAGGELVPTVTWAPDRGAVVASAHVNSDASYLPVEVPDPESDSPDVGNATMLAVTAVDDGSIGLQRLELTSLQPGGGQSFVRENGYDVAQLEDGPVTGATVAYDNRAQGSISDASYALAVRSGTTNHVWFGLIGRSVSPPDRVIAQDGACAGDDVPQLSLATAPGVNGSPFTGVVCTVTTSGGTVVQRWSDVTADADNPSPPTFPTAPNPVATTTLPTLTAVRPFATWPCVLLGQWAADQQPTRPACLSDLATDLVGTSDRARYYQLPVIGGPGGVATRDIAGAVDGAPAVVDQLPLARTTLTVRNTARAAVEGTTAPTPVVYVMPAPMVGGLVQPSSGTPVAFGTAAGTGTGGQASFGTSVGATVSATIGDPTLAALQLTASAERATKTTDGTETTQVSSQTVNNNLNQALVVYTVTPVWQWTGAVVTDSTGIGTTNSAKVLTQIAKRTGTRKPVLEGRSVAELARTDPALFGTTGTYGPTLSSVFGPGTLGGGGRTVTGADPDAYPTFSTTGSVVPRQDGQAYCDTRTGSQGVTSINSGVPSPYTEADVTAGGPSYLSSPDAPVRVGVGDGVSNELQVTVASTATTSYSTDFSVNTSAGVTIGGVGATLDAGFTIGNQTSVSTTTSQTFAAEIGSIRGAYGSGLDQALIDRITDALRSETYAWEPFMCRRTTSLPGGGQTAALVLGFATAGFTGLADVGTTGTPVGITGGASATGTPPVVARGAALRFTRTGPAATYRVVVLDSRGSPAATLDTPVLTPAAATAQNSTLAVRLPTGLSKGRYSWRPSAISFNGVTVTGAPRYFTIS